MVSVMEPPHSSDCWIVGTRTKQWIRSVEVDNMIGAEDLDSSEAVGEEETLKYKLILEK